VVSPDNILKPVHTHYGPLGMSFRRQSLREYSLILFYQVGRAVRRRQLSGNGLFWNSSGAQQSEVSF